VKNTSRRRLRHTRRHPLSLTVYLRDDPALDRRHAHGRRASPRHLARPAAVCLRRLRSPPTGNPMTGCSSNRGRRDTRSCSTRDAGHRRVRVSESSKRMASDVTTRLPADGHPSAVRRRRQLRRLCATAVTLAVADTASLVTTPWHTAGTTGHAVGPRRRRTSRPLSCDRWDRWRDSGSPLR
jgi:hypothetical protein